MLESRGFRHFSAYKNLQNSTKFYKNTLAGSVLSQNLAATHLRAAGSELKQVEPTLRLWHKEVVLQPNHFKIPGLQVLTDSNTFLAPQTVGCPAGHALCKWNSSQVWQRVLLEYLPDRPSLITPKTRQ